MGSGGCNRRPDKIQSLLVGNQLEEIMKFKAYGHACGCKFDQTKWLNLCPTHQAEHDEIHKRAQDEYHAARVVAELTKQVQS